MRTLSQNCEQTLQKLRTNRIVNKRAFLTNVVSLSLSILSLFFFVLSLSLYLSPLHFSSLLFSLFSPSLSLSISLPQKPILVDHTLRASDINHGNEYENASTDQGNNDCHQSDRGADTRVLVATSGICRKGVGSEGTDQGTVRVPFCVWPSHALSSKRITKPYSEPIQNVLPTIPNCILEILATVLNLYSDKICFLF